MQPPPHKPSSALRLFPDLVPEIAAKPLIGEEPDPADAPLFTPSAQEPEPDQGSLLAEPTRPYRVPLYKISLIRDGSLARPSPKIRHSADMEALLRPYFAPLDREHFVVVLLDAQYAVIGLNTVSVGSLTRSIVHPREVFKAAIVANACAVIFAHNHPSGTPTPSPEDKALTTRLVQCGELLGISVLDHVILGDPGIFSFADSGLILNTTR